MSAVAQQYDLDPNSLMTNRGDVIGLGRIKIPKMPKLGFDCDIPLLSFVVIKEKSGNGYIATCIHLQMDGYGDSVDEAKGDMIDSIWNYLRENFRYEEQKENAWNNIRDLFKSNPQSGELWDKYHILQVELAKKGIAADRYSELNKRVLQEKVSKLEAAIGEKDLYISLYMAELLKNEIALQKGIELFGNDELRENIEPNKFEALIGRKNLYIYSCISEIKTHSIIEFEEKQKAAA
jgi:hypothetical protein